MHKRNFQGFYLSRDADYIKVKADVRFEAIPFILFSEQRAGFPLKPEMPRRGINSYPKGQSLIIGKG
jgi:hypothetical protein